MSRVVTIVSTVCSKDWRKLMAFSRPAG